MISKLSKNDKIANNSIACKAADWNFNPVATKTENLRDRYQNDNTLTLSPVLVRITAKTNKPQILSALHTDNEEIAVV